HTYLSIHSLHPYSSSHGHFRQSQRSHGPNQESKPSISIDILYRDNITMYLSDKEHNSHYSATTPSILPLKYGTRGLVPEKEPA
ncbi:hypothetical protein OFB65_26550, partial [Escherichia coli]|nr:hypothetical protein [Escherichia coli]